MPKMLDEALRLADIGLRVFPLNGKTPIGGHGCLDATTDALQIESWWERYPKANIGIATGKGIVAIDIDVKKDGGRRLKSLIGNNPWPKTVCAASGRGGRHFYFGVSKSISMPNNSSLGGTGIEVMYDGRYVVAPPSVHPITKKSYEWVRDPEESECYEVPRWVAELNAQDAKKRGLATWGNPEEIREGEGRNNYLTSIAGSLRRRGFTAGEIYDALIPRNERVCKPPLSTKEVQTIARSIARYKPQDPMVAAEFSDIGNAERFAAFAKGSMIHVPGVGWHAWTGNRWEPDPDVRVQETAKRVTREMFNAAHDIKDDDGEACAKLRKWATSSSMKARVDAMTKLGSTHDGIMVTNGSLDQNHFWINMQNGTLDLETEELREPSSKDLLTNITSTAYDPEAECPLWEEFVGQVLPDPDIREYTRRAVGYSLTGSTQEQCFFLMYGSGSNGKSTFIETLRYMLGSYASQIEAAALMGGFRQAGSATPDLMRLRGPRFVVSAEIGEGARLNEAMIKSITGSDMITARALYKGPVDFIPHFKLWMHSNYRPTVKGMDRGIWRRVKFIPFTQVFKRPDRKLADRLRVELPGIFNWALRGYTEWHKWGLREPKAIRAETARYRMGMDVVGQFVGEQCTVKTNVKEGSSELWEAFSRWQDTLPRSERIGRNGFFQRLEGMDFERRRARIKGGRKIDCYAGLKLEEESGVQFVVRRKGI